MTRTLPLNILGFMLALAIATLAACSGVSQSQVPLPTEDSTAALMGTPPVISVRPRRVRLPLLGTASVIVEERAYSGTFTSSSVGSSTCGRHARTIAGWTPKGGHGPKLRVQIDASNLGQCVIAFRDTEHRVGTLSVVVETITPSPSPSPTESPTVSFVPLSDVNAFRFGFGDDGSGMVQNSIAPGPDGAVWFTEQARIGRITMTGAVSEFPIPTASSVPGGIVAGSDGAMWFTEQATPAIARITTSGQITEYPLPPGSEPLFLASGSDGALWATDFDGTIDRVTTNGVLTAQYPIPTANSRPAAIVAGPDGNLWFAERIGNIAKITTTGAVTEYRVPPPPVKQSPVPQQFQPYALTVGPDHNIWFSGCAPLQVARIGYIRPNGRFKTFIYPQMTWPSYGIAADDHDVFASLFQAAILSIATDGTWTDLGSSVFYNHGTVQIGGMTRGPDGAFWFTSAYYQRSNGFNAAIGRLDPNEPAAVHRQ